MIFFLMYQIASVLSNLWLSAWTENDILKNETLRNESVFGNIYDSTQNMYLGIYGGLGFAQGGIWYISMS